MENKESKIRKSDTYVDIGTHKLRVVLSDVPSEYTIILEAGGGMFSSAYQEIQDNIAQQTENRVISYDRSGFGGSELGPKDFTALDEVKSLKKLLEIQGFNDNYVLVGHSYGGFLVLLFTLQYPQLVKGLVLIDPMNVIFVDRFGLDNLNAVTPYIENPTQNYEKAGIPCKVAYYVGAFPVCLPLGANEGKLVNTVLFLSQDSGILGNEYLKSNRMNR